MNKTSFALAGLLSAVLGASAQDYVVHSFKKTQLTDKFWCEGAHFADFNRDGKMDVVSGPYWYEGPEFKKGREYYAATKTFKLKKSDGTEETVAGFEGALGPNNAYSDNFLTYTWDFNKDGWTDVLVLGFPGAESWWFENPRGKDQLWQRHTAIDVTDNESPTFGDLTGDGKPEVIFHTGGHLGYAEPDWDHPANKFKFHKISPAGGWQRFTHGYGYGDVNGDGRLDILEKDGWWEQPKSLEGDPEWTKHPVDFGTGGAQMYAYDVNGDGFNDVITSLAAHGWGLAWYEQVRKNGAITVEQHIIMNKEPKENKYGVKFSQLHAIDLIDMDGDGLKDIVTGKRFWAHGKTGDAEPNAPAVLYWFKLVRGADKSVDFIPYLIDDNSGVGTQVTAADLNGDHLPDIVVGNKKGTFVHIHSATKVSKDEWEKAKPKPYVSASAQAPQGIKPVLEKAIDPTKVARQNEVPPPDSVKFAGLSPEKAAKEMTLPPGFSAKLFAGEPDVKQPIAFALDDRGRVWVAEAYTYPVPAPKGQGKDRILVFEDTDGDGKFDRRTVFFEGLNLVSGLEVGFGGVWVGAAPYLMFIPIKDGDEPKPAGEPRIVLDGWASQDTHETLNTFTWGPDGWLYGCHGIFTHSKVGKPGTPENERTRINAGVWRYHPTKQRFEVFAEGTSNPWGIDFDENGQCFIEACVIPHLFHIIQGAHYERQAGQDFNPHVYKDITTIADHRHYAGDKGPHAANGRSEAAGGGHAHAGLMVYLGDSWPASYRGQVFMNNIHGQRINQDNPVAQGSGFVGKHAPDFLAFNDSWSQVLNLLSDQNGSVYMIDWYDKNQCHHGDVNGHDRSNGRIFKVVYNDQKWTPVDLQKLSGTELVKLQLHTNDWYVRHARRILQERGANPEVHAALVKIAKENSDPSRRLRGLWALHVTGGLTEEIAWDLLQDTSDYVRAWAIQSLLEDGKPSLGILEQFAALARRDASAVVRLYLASALQRVPVPLRSRILEGLFVHAEDSNDHNLPLMYWYAAEPVVGQESAKAIALLGKAKIPMLREFVTRRMASAAKSTAAAR